MYLFHNIILLLVFASTLCSQDLSTAFVKYYLTEKHFLADAPMLATERRGKAHLEVTFNEKKQPVLKRWLNNDQDLIKEEMFVYKAEALQKRIFLDRERKTDKVIHYGELEPWSMEFRKFVRKDNSKFHFDDQQTEFTLQGGEEISDILFRTIDGHEYGQITLAYDHLGFLKEEIWRTLPGNKVVRKFIYSTDIMNHVQEIREYVGEDELISHVALSMATEDQLYLTPPPRTGNLLDEVDVIIKELNTHRLTTAVPALIPHTEWDRLTTMKNEQMDIEIIAIEKQFLKFQLPNEAEVLSIPLEKVSMVKNKYGELLYP